MELKELKAMAEQKRQSELKMNAHQDLMKKESDLAELRTQLIFSFALLDSYVQSISNDRIQKAIESGDKRLKVTIDKKSIIRLKNEIIDDPNCYMPVDINQWKKGFKWMGEPIPCALFDRLKELCDAGLYSYIDDGKIVIDDVYENDGYPRFKTYWTDPSIIVRW